ncbi:MAG: carboxypeptidase regulatory-like domain-containing protein [Abitibacteriaceae bacterium]|nr:carboxypeptidase regulatory-like domain-containing protein [Abditibacteriaceae bacterium]
MRSPHSYNSFIEGTVYDRHDKTPLADIEIGIGSDETDSYGKVKTDHQGHYRIPVALGKGYLITAEGAAYSDFAFQDLIIPANGMKRDIGLLKKGVVKGTVRDTSGRPIAGARLFFFGPSGYNGDKVITATDGSFYTDALDIDYDANPTQYELLITQPKYSYIETKLSVQPHYAATDEHVANFVLLARAIVKGRITSQGKAIKDASLVPALINGTMPFDSNTDNQEIDSLIQMTDSNGNYTLSLSAPQTYNIDISGEDTVATRVQMHLVPGQSITINRDLAPFPYGSIAGRVINLAGHQVVGAAIELWTPRTSETDPVAYTDKRGRYVVRKVAPGDDYVVFAYMPKAQMRTGPNKESVRVRSYKTTIVNLRGDTVPPRCHILSPLPGATVKGIVSVRAKGTDNDGVSVIVLMVENEWIKDVEISHTDEGLPFDGKPSQTHWVRRGRAAFEWDSRKVSDGWHLLRIDVYDIDGNMASRTVKVKVHNAR